MEKINTHPNQHDGDEQIHSVGDQDTRRITLTHLTVMNKSQYTVVEKDMWRVSLTQTHLMMNKNIWQFKSNSQMYTRQKLRAPSPKSHTHRHAHTDRPHGEELSTNWAQFCRLHESLTCDLHPTHPSQHWNGCHSLHLKQNTEMVL